MKEKALRIHSLHEKTAASVLLKPFISSNEWCHTTDPPPPLAHKRNSIFKCKQHTCTLHDPWGPEKYDYTMTFVSNFDIQATFSAIHKQLYVLYFIGHPFSFDHSNSFANKKCIQNIKLNNTNQWSSSKCLYFTK